VTAPDDRLVLSPGTVIVGVADLPARVREQLSDDGQTGFAVTRRHGRASSTLVDEALAELLGEFRSPSTVVEAIMRYSRRLGRDPEDALTDAYPALRRCVRQGYLVTPGSERSKPVEPAFAVGRQVAGGTVVRCVRVLDDTELHQVALDAGGMAALKVLRPGRSSFGAGVLRREAALLRHLDGRVAPRLLGEGETDGCSWLALEWCDGVHAGRAAAAARRAHAAEGELLDLCVRVTEAYAQLHELGVIHADVHPGNVMVAPTGAVRLVDFGLARRAGVDALPPRGGVQAFYDPEHAAASRAGRRAGPATFASDQYSLGAMLYELLTGSAYLELALETDAMLRQIVEDEPLPFTRRGRRPWPEVERLLRAALAKDPGARLPSTRELARRLAAATAPAPAVGVTRSAGLEQLLDAVLEKARPGGSWFEHGLPRGAPLCSVAYGAAGLAAAIRRVAVLRADPELLSLADEWAVRAGREATGPGAFSSEEMGLTARQTGSVSPFHCLSGVHAVQGLVSHALGDHGARQRALDGFVAESRRPCDNLDLTLGRSGTLLAAALLLEAVSGARYVSLDGLIELGNETLAGLWAAIDAMPPVPEAKAVGYLGVAHGWAGLLLASLRWCRAAGATRPPGLVERLDQLAQLALLDGPAARWPAHPRRRSGTPPTPGWCHGSAGYVHLWTTAHQALGDDRWATLAEQAAWGAYTSPNGIAQLCCGHGGQAYGLLELYRATGERRWLTSAGELAVRAADAGSATLAHAPVAGSLHKGITGIAVLAAELEQPELAAMPFFARES
jgi:serine/threonine protein kinase